MVFYWTCPYCDRDTTITDTYQTNEFSLTLDNADGHRKFVALIVVCPNPKCQKFTLRLDMYKYERTEDQLGNARWRTGPQLQTWKLIPPSNAKVFPEYVPKPIRDDYLEECLIRDLSPKASATLSRRCLQGIIRDFWGVSKGRLADEIEAIKDSTDPLTWKAIDAVRKIGNIGAHMEKDINVIVDVEPDEAQKLIGLIELLIEDSYITRYERNERLRGIVKIQQVKDAAKTAAVKTN
jgi:hypothetical protein